MQYIPRLLTRVHNSTSDVRSSLRLECNIFRVSRRECGIQVLTLSRSHVLTPLTLLLSYTLSSAACLKSSRDLRHVQTAHCFSYNSPPAPLSNFSSVIGNGFSRERGVVDFICNKCLCKANCFCRTHSSQFTTHELIIYFSVCPAS